LVRLEITRGSMSEYRKADQLHKQYEIGKVYNNQKTIISLKEPPNKKVKAKKSNKVAAEKVIKIRLDPEKEQDQIFKRWSTTARKA
jgi:hypothetical protein